MIKAEHFRQAIQDRLDELSGRMVAIETELDQPKSKDLGDQAIDLEDDEVLETLGKVAQLEVRHLRAALERLDDGTFGKCIMCEEPISEERLKVLPQTRLCRTCAQEGAP